MKSVKTAIVVIAAAILMAACAKKEEAVVEPVTVEPAYTGKYK